MSDCINKAGYTKKQAQTIVNRRTKGRQKIRRHRPRYLRAYACDDCGQWHITHCRNPPPREA